MAGHDPTQFDRILGWPVREGLLAFVEILRGEAMEMYQNQLLAASLHGVKAPKPPSILEL